MSMKLFYEKDKVIPVDGHSVPDFDDSELNKYPEGYRYLGAAQSTLGHHILMICPHCKIRPSSKCIMP